ncbi:hypothetical protein CLOM_g13483 [Closterium sp. NIES-68]|nr:hypothetical protein CLOM_g13483 [Closterium sp. NIES-68]
MSSSPRPLGSPRSCHADTSPSPSSMLSSDPFQGRLLGPPPADQQWWDGLLFAGPIVVRTGPEQAAWVGGKAWRMYYHGRDSEDWGMGVHAQPGTPFGRVGMALSHDGVTWERYHGPLPGGAIFDPSDDPSAFDCVHVGCSDVHLMPDGTWLMLYYAGGLDPGRFPAWPAGKTALGAQMRCGIATSADGVTWQRAKTPFLNIGGAGSWDELAVSWPRVTALSTQRAMGRGQAEDCVDSTGGGRVQEMEGAKAEGGKLEGRKAERGKAEDMILASFADVAEADWLLTYQSVGDPHAPGHAHVGEGREVERVPESVPQYCYTIGSAAFDPCTKKWIKRGSCIRRGPIGAWDEAGANRRHVLPLAAFGPKAVQKWEGLHHQGKKGEDSLATGEAGGPPVLLMFYEGARYNGTYAIGLAYCLDGGETWDKARHIGPEPGGPILQPRFGEEVWDNMLVGTPHLVVSGGEEGSGKVLMYYTGVGEVSGYGRVRGIGALVWEGGDSGDLGKWTRLVVD